MSTFAAFRAVTGLQRPPGSHGCPPVEVVPGVWTAHFHDIETVEALTNACPGVTTVVNCAIAQCPTRPGSYGDIVDVMLIDLLDDPNEMKKACALPDGPAKVAALAALPEFSPEECAGDAKQHFDAVTAAIIKTSQAGGSTMIHCHASLSRSVAFIVAYMMKTSGLTAVAAAAAMKAKWAATWPCDTFVNQLIEYESELKAAAAATAASVETAAPQ